MSPTLSFIGGQLAIAVGLYLLSRHIGWEACVAIWLVVEGVITTVHGLVGDHGED